MCERCLGRGCDVHHRQRRRAGGHGIENLVYLCRTCHSWVHAHPAEARGEGFIVSASVAQDEIVNHPIYRFGQPIYLALNGTYVSSQLPKEEA